MHPGRLNALPVGIAARPGVVQRFERTVLLLQPGAERRDGALAVAVQEFLGISPDVARPGRLNVRLIPAVVGKKRFVRCDHPDEFLDVLRARFAHRLPIEAQSGPAAGDIIRAALEAHGPSARIDKARIRIFLFQPPRRQLKHEAAQHLKAELVAVTHHLFNFVENPLVRLGIHIVPIGPDANQVELVLFGNGFDHVAPQRARRAGRTEELRAVKEPGALGRPGDGICGSTSPPGWGGACPDLPGARSPARLRHEAAPSKSDTRGCILYEFST